MIINIITNKGLKYLTLHLIYFTPCSLLEKEMVTSGSTEL